MKLLAKLFGWLRPATKASVDPEVDAKLAALAQQAREINQNPAAPADFDTSDPSPIQTVTPPPAAVIQPKARPASNLRPTPAKPVIRYGKGEERRYPSIDAAAKDTGIDRAGISNCCRGYRRTAGGYHWRYAQGGRGLKSLKGKIQKTTPPVLNARCQNSAILLLTPSGDIWGPFLGRTHALRRARAKNRTEVE